MTAFGQCTYPGRRPAAAPMWRRQDPQTMSQFMARVDTSGGPDGCHPWMGRRKSPEPGRAYGEFRIAGRWFRAHRWLLGHLRGRALGRGEVACHRCDNPPCVNPRHLYVGTQQQNMQDCAQRGRIRGGAPEIRRALTHCKNGHEFTPENTIQRAKGGRLCRACKNLHGRRRMALLRAARKATADV